MPIQYPAPIGFTATDRFLFEERVAPCLDSHARVLFPGGTGPLQGGAGRFGLALGRVGIAGRQAGVLAALPPQVPGRSVSRVSRELSKRMLCLFNVWKVRSLQFQLGTSQKKRRLGDGLFTEEAETEESYTADCDTYLNKLHTLLIAYLLAGCQPLSGVADATKEQTLGADSTAYVEVPLDVMLQYFYRAKRAVAGLPVGKRLAWLQARDSDERSEWVTKFREGTRSLGAVVKELMASRDAHWLPRVVANNHPVPAPAAAPHATVAAPKPAPESKFLSGPVINGKPAAKQMRDGLRLCEGFNKGTCSNKNCGNGAHRCSVILRAERVCGSPAHPAAKCNAILLGI